MMSAMTDTVTGTPADGTAVDGAVAEYSPELELIKAVPFSNYGAKGDQAFKVVSDNCNACHR